MHHCAE